MNMLLPLGTLALLASGPALQPLFSTQVVHATMIPGSPLSPPPMAPGLEVIDFEAHPAGTVLSSLFGDGGTGPIAVFAANPRLGDFNAALAFDTANPTGGDWDLGTPHKDFGGPGVGKGGAASSPWVNDSPLHKVLIVAENLVDSDGDGLVDDPDDADVAASYIDFDFGAVGTVALHGMTIIDVEAKEDAATVEFYGAGDHLISTATLPNVGDNGVAQVAFGPVSGVVRMRVILNGSGAIDSVLFQEEVSCDAGLGDRVWLDVDGDGLQDGDEAGIPDVGLTLETLDGALLASTHTDAHGNYWFGDLCADTYVVRVDESTLPAGLLPSVCNAGDDDALDNDCSPQTVVLGAGAQDPTNDFGYVPFEPGVEGCTPGYWKQHHHFDSWPAGYAPDMLFHTFFEDAFPGMTLLQVLRQGGGGLIALGRHTVAGLLNAASDGVAYGMTPAEVMDAFDAVYPGGKSDYNGLKDVFEKMNEAGCPLN